MPLVPRDDPYAGYNFEITITEISDDGKAVKGSFAEVSGLEAEVAPIDYRTGSEDTRYRKVSGLQKFSNITLKRGVIADLAFWNWILLAMRGQVKRTDGAIALHDENHKEVMRWQFTRGWPCKYTGPGLNAKNNEIAIETLEICHEGLSIEGQAS
jgi:phage tail-like protein